MNALLVPHRTNPGEVCTIQVITRQEADLAEWDGDSNQAQVSFAGTGQVVSWIRIPSGGRDGDRDTHR